MTVSEANRFLLPWQAGQKGIQSYMGQQVEALPLEEAVGQLREAEEELGAANRELEKVLKHLGWDQTPR